MLRPGTGIGTNVGGNLGQTPGIGDTVSFEDITAAGAGVTVTLTAGAGPVSQQAGGSVSEIENLTGSINGDHLTGEQTRTSSSASTATTC